MNIVAIYFAALIQGLALAAFPALSTVFTSPEGFHLSSTGYGGLFVPQAVLSIIASLLSSRKSLKFTFLAGITANFIAMLLLGISALEPSYGILLLGTASLGIGFGLTAPTINNYAVQFFPQKKDAAVLILNALLGLGTALSPILTIIFTTWWAFPSLLALILLCLLLFSLGLSLPEKKLKERIKSSLPNTFWLFAPFALVYGILETLNGNWAMIYLHKNLQASAALSSLGLSVFWAMVTIGRIFFFALAGFISPKVTFCLLPFVIAIALVFIDFTSSNIAVFAFGLAGLGCSALLPLMISFADQVSLNIGYLFAIYLLGYGITAFGVGPLQNLGWDLSTIFGIGSILAIMLGLLSITIKKTVTP